MKRDFKIWIGALFVALFAGVAMAFGADHSAVVHASSAVPFGGMAIGAINMFDTRTMTRSLEQLYVPTSYLRDSFFGSIERHTTRYVDIDIVKGGRKVAAYVHPRNEGSKVDKRGFSTKSYKAPYTKEKMVTTAEEYLTRNAGDVIYTADTPEARAAKELGKNLRELGERVDRLEELQAAQALQTGKILVKGEDVDDIIDFGFAPEQLPVLTNTAKWSDTTNSTPLDDLQKWHEETRKRSGLVPSMVLADSAAIRFLLKNKNVIGNTGLLSSFRVTLGQIDPQKMNAQGVKYWGYLQDPGIDLWSYDAYYEDPVSGLTVPYINPGTVLMIGEGARLTRHYGAIEDLGATAQVSRFAKSWVTDDPSARWVMVQSAPLCDPHQIDAITCATVL